jgi:hypothetical protein
MTLTDAARLAAQRNSYVDCTVIEGSLNVGDATMARLTVARALVNGHVAVQRGLSPDWHYITPEQAETIVIEVVEP